MNELKEARKELEVAKETLESNGYQRQLVYKLTYQKDGTWKHIYFEDKEEADVILVGVPFDKNASVGKGASFAPKVLRELSYHSSV